MDSSTLEAAALARNDPAPDSSSPNITAEASSISIPPELVMHVLKLSIAGKPSNDSEVRKALCTYSVLSKAYQSWAQKKLFEWLSVTEELQSIEVGDLLSYDPQLAEAVQTLELGPECWERYCTGPGSMQNELIKACPAYKKGELTLKLNWVQLNFDSVHDFPLIKGLVLENVETHLDSGDDLSEFGAGPRKKPFVNLTSLEIISFDDSYHQDPFEGSLFPALTIIIDRRRVEPAGIGYENFVGPYNSALPQLTALYLNHMDEFLIPAIKKCINLVFLDLPFEPFAASIARAIAHIPAAARIISKSPHTILPPQLRALRLHRVPPSDKYDFAFYEIEEGMEDAEGIVRARLQKGTGAEGKGKLEALMFPKDARWA